MLSHVGKQSGQSVIAIFLSLSILFGVGVAALQLAGLGLRSLHLQEAATAGATTLAHGLRVGDPTSEPCWQATDGLLRPAATNRLRLITVGVSAIARGVVASPFVFASTSSRSASLWLR